MLVSNEDEDLVVDDVKKDNGLGKDSDTDSTSDNEIDRFAQMMMTVLRGDGYGEMESERENEWLS